MNCDEDFTQTCDEDTIAAEIEIQVGGTTLEILDANCNARCQNELNINGFCEYEMDHCVCHDRT